jgi:hypothetical protein
LIWEYYRWAIQMVVFLGVQVAVPVWVFSACWWYLSHRVAEFPLEERIQWERKRLQDGAMRKSNKRPDEVEIGQRGTLKHPRENGWWQEGKRRGSKPWELLTSKHPAAKEEQLTKDTAGRRAKSNQQLANLSHTEAWGGSFRWWILIFEMSLVLSMDFQ